MTEPKNRFSLRRVHHYGDGRLREMEAPVVGELPVTVFLNGREIITFLASDDGLDFLAAGFLSSEGLVESREDILEIQVDREGGRVHVSAARSDELAEKLLERRTITSGCGKGTTFYHALDALQVKTVPEGPAVGIERIPELMRLMHRRSELYRLAGGVHSAALCTVEKIVIFRDDIGRHNAIDKIHGECFLRQVRTDDKLLLTTGRISSEILIKAGKMGVPLLVSRSGPTELALDMADRLGITVVGRVRGGELKVYSHPERIEL